MAAVRNNLFTLVCHYSTLSHLFKFILNWSCLSSRRIINQFLCDLSTILLESWHFHQNKDDFIAPLKKIDKYLITHFANFLERLKGIKEGDGNLLDHSMIVYGSAISDGNHHNHNDLPILLAGGGSGSITTNRHVVYPKNTPLNNLFLSMLDRMDVRIDQLGDSTARLDRVSIWRRALVDIKSPFQFGKFLFLLVMARCIINLFRRPIIVLLVHLSRCYEFEVVTPFPRRLSMRPAVIRRERPSHREAILRRVRSSSNRPNRVTCW